MPKIEQDAAKGAAVYTRPVLAIYDAFVVGFSNSFLWKCPSHLLVDFYNQHVSEEHLDVGVGTGYFLDKCRFPSPSQNLTLVDLNPNCLQITARRLRRYRPTCHVANVLKPISIGDSSFGSIGLNYLVHCLPGNLTSKSAVFANLKPLLKPGGVIFGCDDSGCRCKARFSGWKINGHLQRERHIQQFLGQPRGYAGSFEAKFF